MKINCRSITLFTTGVILLAGSSSIVVFGKKKALLMKGSRGSLKTPSSFVSSSSSSSRSLSNDDNDEVYETMDGVMVSTVSDIDILPSRHLTYSYYYGDSESGNSVADGNSDDSDEDSDSSDKDSPFIDHCHDACVASGGLSIGSLITPPVSVEDWKNSKDVYCCDGGASYMKVVYQAGNDETGLLTFDPSIAAEFSTCDLVYQKSKNGKKIGNGNAGNGNGNNNGGGDLAVRFVPCSDACVLEPLTGVPCSETTSVMEVTNGTEVCFAMVNIVTDEVHFDQKMGTNVYFYFIPDGAGADDGKFLKKEKRKRYLFWLVFSLFCLHLLTICSYIYIYIYSILSLPE
jgi:hypothetical protein